MSPTPCESGVPTGDQEWTRHLAQLHLASLLIVIESRMSSALRAVIEPEDVLQESLMQAWRDRGAATIESPRAFRAWVLAIIDNRIRDLAERFQTLKRGGGRPTVPLDGRPGTEPLGSTTPSRLASVREEASAMRAALALVPEEFRAVVELRLFHQLTLAQIADKLNIGLGAARGRLRRGTELYRERLRAARIGQTSMATSQAPVRPDAAS